MLIIILRQNEIMLSVCIPIYNFDIRDTVNELIKQLLSSGVEYEIILFDDASVSSFKIINRDVHKLGGIVLKELPENVGRSSIRNYLAKEAKYPYILFLDCDVIIHQSDFIQNYLSAINDNTQVICGGRVYPSVKVEKQRLLRWKYGIKLESQSAEVRCQNPSKSFMTNNFIISTLIFDKLKFNEEISSYGHEDTLFGFELKNLGIIPVHINNPVLNGDIETDTEFLKKTKEGVLNLSKLYTMFKQQKGFVQDVTLLFMYEKVKKNKLFLITLGFFESSLRWVLENGLTNIFIFNLYKLSIFINSQKQS